MEAWEATPISQLAPLEAYCAQIDSRLSYCDAWGSCTYHKNKCPDQPFLAAPVVPSVSACLTSNMDYCNNYSMPEQSTACKNGVSYSQRPRMSINSDTLRSMTLFPDAFLDGMSRSLKCHSGVMPLG
jgi:hypothetical protein